ncbi:MAG: MFS transporter [Burkholderiales bacterium RIFCSPLOWO2_12_FULL_64_99]|nr:MAG: MFS transporter [Burkholderiales bacterium RIFCSPHIGHO2_12_FULL_63_20]OGB62102.1 MAG: MFS transporter [Burkholderiales bacterium RIFCSPLOWO2_12_FULL_64_99]
MTSATHTAHSDHAATLRLLGLAGFSAMAALRICDAMLPSLVHSFQVSTGDAAWVVSSFALAYGVLQLFYGPLGDAMGKLQVITWACLASALICLLTALSPNFTTLVIARALMGASAAAVIPLSLAWVGDQVAYDLRQETLARLLGSIVLGMMAGQWFGGFASEMWGWQSAFLALGLGFLIAAISLLRRRASATSAASAVPLSARASIARTTALFQIPRVRWVLGFALIEGALAYGWLPFAPAWLVSQFGFSISTAAAIMVLYGVGGLLYSQFARRWLTLLGERGLALGGGLLLAASVIGIAWSPISAFAIGGCGLAGLGFYMLHSTLQTQATQMAPEARGTGMTLFACSLFLGQALGVLVVGLFVDQGGLLTSFSAIAALLCVTGFAVSRGVQGRAPAATPPSHNVS